mgnify:CR=1 FL=1
MTDIKKLLDKAKELEKNMKESQKRISEIKADGVSGGDKVKITLNGDGELVKIYIAPDLLNEKIDILYDLIIAAHNNAKISIKQKTSEEISKVSTDLGVQGIKWPF